MLLEKYKELETFLFAGSTIRDYFYDPVKIFGGVFLIVAVSYLLRCLWNWSRTKRINLLAKKKQQQEPTPKFAQHSWFASDFLDRPSYCQVCEELFTHGHACEVCGARAHSKCRKKFKETCKYSSFSPSSSNNTGSDTNSKTKMQHQWMKGNLPLTSICFVCKESCGNEPKLADYRCLWCQRTVHEACITQDILSHLSSTSTTSSPSSLPTSCCDFGKYRNMILPPSSVAADPKCWKITSNWTDDTTPLLIFVHPKSGGNEGTRLFRTFKQIFNPIQVCDVSKGKGPLSLLEMARDILPRCKVLVCGGDGTVGWVLSTLDKLNLQSPPPTAIVPLGTGNDLSRCLGWGGGYDEEGEDFFDELLASVEHSKPVLLDRWKVVVTPQRGRIGKLFSKKTKEVVLNNYMSIGVDAQITWQFHSNRILYPDWFASRFINKCWYGIFGAKEFLIEQSCRELPKYMEIEVDGKALDITGLQGVIILNINSYAGGVDVWGKSPSDPYQQPRVDDQMFEIVGLSSSLHIGQVIVGVSECKRLGQGRELKIVWKGQSQVDASPDPKEKSIKTPTVPIQVDGEPWLQTPSTITLSFYKQLPMIKRVV
eukprot:TRINITY_DN15476_c0_g1_i1.p1 TRINITY_DN15476_c0_g1~~TRINITY_DN15476_c0_g1_i1.p1  ORF type:complete len:596 (-),score=90.75 TRINITY_DN15476_c0_g1_i1:51-1838(-)